LSTRETVAGDTCARAATSARVTVIVARPPVRVMFGLSGNLTAAITVRPLEQLDPLAVLSRPLLRG
jgi:hypothetical protein